MTQTGTTVGTPHYMSPEHARGAPVDSRADLYSLGVVLFLLLTGHLPYDSDSAVAIGVMHISDSIPRLPEHLAVFQPLIDRVLAKNPDDRFQTGSELVEALEAFDRETLDSLERASERSLMVEAGDESPTLHQPQAVMTEPPGGGDVESGADSEVSGDYLAVHDDDRIDWEAAPEEPRGYGWVWILLIVLVVAGGGFYWQEPLRAQWDRQVAPLLDAPSTQTREVVSSDVIDEAVKDQPPAPGASKPMTEPVTESPEAVQADDPSSKVAPPDLADVISLPEDSTEPSTAPSTEPTTEPSGRSTTVSEDVEQTRDQRIQVISETASDRAERGDLDGALGHLDRGISEFPDSEKLALQRERLVSLQEAQRREEAEQQAQAAREARLQTQIGILERLLADGALEQAGEQLREARNEFPESSALLSLEMEWRERSDAAQQPTIEQARISSQPLDSLTDGQSATLAPTRVLYAGFAYRNFGETSSVIQAILYDGSRQLQIALVPVVIQGNAGETFFRLERPVTGFAEGGYHLDLISDGEALASVSFQVES